MNPVDDYPPRNCTFGKYGWTSEENLLTGERAVLHNFLIPSNVLADVILNFYFSSSSPGKLHLQSSEFDWI